VAATSATAAHHLGARYILFHFPWPYLSMPGRRYEDDGWYFTYAGSAGSAWTEAAMYEASRRVFDRLAEVQAKEAIKIVFEIDGPNPYFFDGDMYTRLFEEFPDLSLCVDTGRLILLGKTHRQDPVALAKRWLPWTHHLHLHDAFWDENGQYHNHVPVSGTGPAAEIARLVVAAQPRANVVVEHDPRKVSPEALEASHNWIVDLVRRRD
jgi:sugar phosphate isomerase/epimerase